MSTAENLQTISMTAGEALPIYRFVFLQADGKCDLVDTDDLRADGVTCEAAAADGDLFAMAPVSQPATVKVEASAAISVGDIVAADGGTGKAKTAAAGAVALYAQGIAKTAAAADGDIIEVLLNPFKNGPDA